MKSFTRSDLHLDRGIVVGVDERGLSDHAVRMGDELGRRLSAPVHRVHAVPRPPDVWPSIDPARGEALTVALLDAARRTIHDRVRALVGEPAAEPGRTAAGAAAAPNSRTAVAEVELVQIVPGYPAPVLLEEVRARKARLLVLGAHAKRQPLDFSNTLRAVFAKSTVSVWVQRGPVEPIRRILAAIDLSQDSLTALGAACVVAKAFDARVRAVHCFHTSAAALAGGLDSAWNALGYPFEEVRRADGAEFERAMSAFDWQGVAHETEFVEGIPLDTLLERATTADLVVLGSHGRTGLASVVLGGTAYGVLKQCQKPVLLVREPKKSFLM